MKKPPFLVKGNQVGVTATAGKLSYEDLQSSVETLKQWGLKPIIAPSVKAAHGYFAGSDEQRKEDLQYMLDEPSIKAVFCARGGYGTTRIIDDIDWAGFNQSPKWLVGFSDITALHLKIHQLGCQSIHAPTLTSWKSEEAVQYIRHILFEEAKPLKSCADVANRLGTCEGHIIGGNLCILAHSIGSSTAVDFSGKILFIEEVGEAAYAIDRLLVQLWRAGCFSNIKGLVVGSLDLTQAQEKDFGMSQVQMVLEKVPENIPVAFNFPIGHQPKNFAVSCGAYARLHVDELGATLDFDVSPI